MILHNHVRPAPARPTARCGGPALCRQCRVEQLLVEFLERNSMTVGDDELAATVEELLALRDRPWPAP